MEPKSKPAFHRPRRIELEYQREIDRVMQRWLDNPLPDSLDGILETLNRFGKAEEIVAAQSERLAAGMITAVAKGNATSWRAAARKSTQSGRIYHLLRNEMQGPVGDRMRFYVQQNADLIRSIPLELRRETAAYVTEHQMKGERADVIAYNLRQKLPRMAASKIALISRTQVATAATAISRSRAENLNLHWYEWLTSEDGRVRSSHRIMDRVLVNWNDPPSPEALLGIKSTLGHYHAGNCPNCRCDANVVVDLEQLVFPHKVYTAGRIIRMKKLDFIQLSGMAA